MNKLLVLDIDGTLRDHEKTDGRIPLSTEEALHQALHNTDTYCLVDTGQTLEHVLGLLLQVFGRNLLYSGRVAVAYERGVGLYLGSPIGVRKDLLFAELDMRLVHTFDHIRNEVFQTCTNELGWNCLDYHLQGGEFNIALKPTPAEGSPKAQAITQASAKVLVGLLAKAAAPIAGLGREGLEAALLTHFRNNPHLRAILPEPLTEPVPLPDWLLEVGLFHYPGDLTGLNAHQLSKAAALKRALTWWDLQQPATLVVGDGLEDLELMQAIKGWPNSLVACPQNAWPDVLRYVVQQEGFVYLPGRAEEAFDRMCE